jgi:hypothetical protein
VSGSPIKWDGSEILKIKYPEMNFLDSCEKKKKDGKNKVCLGQKENGEKKFIFFFFKECQKVVDPL